MKHQLVPDFKVTINTIQEEINNWAQKVRDSRSYVTSVNDDSTETDTFDDNDITNINNNNNLLMLDVNNDSDIINNIKSILNYDINDYSQTQNYLYTQQRA